MNMFIASANFINTTTMLSLTTNSALASYIFDRDDSTVWETTGYTGATGAAIQITFPDSVTVDTIILKNINWKSFTISHGTLGGASTFSILSLSPTNVVNFSSNSQTNFCFNVGTATSVKIVNILMYGCITVGAEHQVGEVYIGQKKIIFENNPDYEQYNPRFYGKQYTHEMSDGGNATYYIAKRFQAEIERSFISETEHDTLLEVYEEMDSFVFVPFGTASSWDTREYEVNWVGDFDFEKFSSNVYGNGYSGKIVILETPK